MATCGECSFFFRIPEKDSDYAPEKGDCVTEKRDEKGKYWLSKTTFGYSESCTMFKKSVA